MIFERKNPATTAEAVSEFEKARRVRLPQDYKEFLLALNGGYVDRINDYFHVGSWNEFAVEDILGLTDDSGTSIATKHFSNFSDYVHDRLLVIGYASGETLYMDLRETSSHGKVYIRAHDSPPNDPILIDDSGFEGEFDYEEARLFHPVADSFAEFIGMLEPEPK